MNDGPSNRIAMLFLVVWAVVVVLLLIVQIIRMVTV
jgi:hypothetical protein